MTDGLKYRQLKQSRNFGDEHKKALTVPEQELFLGFLASEKTPYHHWHPVFAVMVGTGMRVGEICGLRWSDINLEEGVIDVNHTLVYYNHRDEKGCYYNIHTPKTKAGKRQISMTADVKKAFLDEKVYQGTWNKALRRIIRDCNDAQLLKGEKNPVLLPNFSCHSLRHTLTTRLVEANVNIKVIQELCGHTRKRGGTMPLFFCIK